MLSDDKVVLGGCRQLQASQAAAGIDSAQPMETDAPESAPAATAKAPPVGAQSLAAKLSANLALKRKATEPPEQSSGPDKSKSKR